MVELTIKIDLTEKEFGYIQEEKDINKKIEQIVKRGLKVEYDEGFNKRIASSVFETQNKIIKEE